MSYQNEKQKKKGIDLNCLMFNCFVLQNEFIQKINEVAFYLCTKWNLYTRDTDQTFDIYPPIQDAIICPINIAISCNMIPCTLVVCVSVQGEPVAQIIKVNEFSKVSSTRLHGVTFQKTVIILVAGKRTSNVIFFQQCWRRRMWTDRDRQNLCIVK